MVDKKLQKVNQSPMQFNAETLIAQAIDKNVPVETMEKLLAMRRELKAEQAKIDYDTAMASFQAECPVIEKTKVVKTNTGATAYKYAPIESIVEQVREALKNNNFSYSTDMELLDEGVKICVKVTHIGGHSEVTCMSVPLGTKTNIMSASQVVAAATTFAKRYAFCNAFGILTGDEDNDAAPQPQGKVVAAATPKAPLMMTEFQRKKIFALLGEKGKTEDDLHNYIAKAFNKKSMKEIELPEASKIVETLMAMPNVDVEIDVDEIDEGIAKMQDPNVTGPH